MSENTRPDTIAELRHIHGAVTRALEGALAQSQRFAQAGIPDAETRQALVDYIRCFATMLHDHHLGEDEFVFPYFEDRMPGAPFGALVAQHVEMQSLLDEIQATCDLLAQDGEGTEATQALHDALSRLSVLWHPHIRFEEAQFEPQAMVAVWDAQEAAQFGQEVSAYMQQIIDPEEMRACQAILSAAG